jgi:Cu(I)/Ag(I) efflux system periplasmic protein CusF
MKKFISLILLLCAAAASPTIVLAQAAAQPSAATEKAEMKDATQAEVRKIDKDAKKVTLKHGPIKNLDMPGMTMVFQVKDPALLDKLAVGDKILFTAEQQQGAFVMTGAEKEAAK